MDLRPLHTFPFEYDPTPLAPGEGRIIPPTKENKPTPKPKLTFDARAALERCDRELAEIDARPDLETSPAYLIALGRHDWEREKEFIRQEEADVLRRSREQRLPAL